MTSRLILLRGMLLCHAATLSLCHSSVVVPSDEMADAAMEAIFHGILALEAEKAKLAELGINVKPFTGTGSLLSRQGAHLACIPGCAAEHHQRCLS